MFHDRVLGNLLVAVLLVLLATPGLADDSAETSEEIRNPGVLATDLETVREIAKYARQAVVVIEFTGRDGQRQGLGSGFILSEDGLIATNLHVIGEARPIRVRLLDGRQFDVVEVHATERSQDLAIVRIDASDLTPLPLGDADQLEEGEPLVAVGNPEGLEHSVVTGVSGVRKDVQGMDMIQLAMPIERGNSGGPVLNLDGQVVGLVTMKSLASENIGFAVAANHLKPLLESPNPVAMSRWLTIGVINPRLWETPDDAARWTQRAGRIRVDGMGRGFGGRSVCLSRLPLPEPPFDIAVSVRMAEDDGAAGLVFHAADDRHYGFYPSSGNLRLTRFDGPTVYQWNVIRDEVSAAFRPGEWNDLKVRVRDDGFECFCNDQLVFRSNDARYTSGAVGLVKFRHTTAEFRGFRIGKDLPPSIPDADVVARIHQEVESIPTDRAPDKTLVDSLLQEPTGTRRVLERRARELEQQARRLRQLSESLHARRVREKLVAVLSAESPDLLHAGLLLAALDNDELDVELYREQVDAMAEECRGLMAEHSGADPLDLLHRYLFKEQGFHGSRTNYYSASNSYLNEVIDDREGLPITLSVLYIELARRVGLNVVGIGLPGHFIVEYRPDEGDPRLIDPFNRGQRLSLAAARALVASTTGRVWDDEYLREQSTSEIVHRMLRNLLNAANSSDNPEAALRYLDTLIALGAESTGDRLFKAVICLNTERYQEGLAEVDWVLQHEPDGVLVSQVHRLRDELQSRLDRLAD